MSWAFQETVVQKYRVIIAYDGTNYHGWQVQPDIPTIAGVMQEQFRSVFSDAITLVGASRTDAGVHALGQVAHFSTGLDISPQAMLRAWNAHLPADIHIRSLGLVLPSFHAQRNVVQKVYYYHVFTQRPLPFCARYGLYYRFPLDIEKLDACLGLVIGTHDFRSFTTGYEHESTIRSITSITCIPYRQLRAYRIRIEGPSFLRYMIRRIVGAALHIASSQELDVKHFAHALEEKNPEQQLPTAPAHGLLLRKMWHKPGEEHD